MLSRSTFAVTLQSSLRPIEVDTLPDLEIFHKHPLYVTRASEDGQVRYRLRLGAFPDVGSAEKVAVTIRKQFPAALSSQLSESERHHSSAVKRWSRNIKLPRQESAKPHLALGSEGKVPHVGKENARTTEKSGQDSTRDPICAYALHLHSSWTPFAGEELPELPALHEHVLYTVKMQRDGASWYALRLGFFSTRAKAKQLAAALHKYFPSVKLVPTQASEFRASASSLVVPSKKTREARPGMETGIQPAGRKPVLTKRANGAREQSSRAPAAEAKSHAGRSPAPSARNAPVEGRQRVAEPATLPNVPATPSPVPPSAASPQKQRTESAAASTEYRVIRPSALLSYLLVAAALFLGWQSRGERYLTAESGWGYALGIIGGLMMLVLFLYPLRKKAHFMRHFGAIKHWFTAHIVLGVLGPVLVLFHANFTLGSMNSSVALVCTLLVTGSGFIGRYFHTKVHHRLSGRRATLQELQRQAEAVRENHSAIDLIPELHKRLLTIEQPLLGPTDSFLQSLVRPVTAAMKTRAAELALSYFAASELRRQARHSKRTARNRRHLYKAARHHIVQRLQNARKVAKFTLYERLFSFWHVLHYPLFMILVVAAIIHVVAVHMY